MTEISNYDFFGYDYSQYWKNRKYEDQAEKNIFNRIFSKKKGTWFLDIGGSYGRLTSTYYKHYSHPVILDYSLKTLQNNYKIIKKHYPKVELIAANAYHMPFREDFFDGALMVRVLHHISEPKAYFKELERVMHNNSFYIQEFANKVNLKASIRALLHLNFSFFSEDQYQQPTSKNFEGTKKGEEALFLNFHPKSVKKQLEENHMKVINKYGCSYLRSALLKKILGDKNMMRIEKILQKVLQTTNIPPSIIYESQLREYHASTAKQCKKLEEILICPRCHEELKFSSNRAQCTSCGYVYLKQDNVWDFRVEE